MECIYGCFKNVQYTTRPMNYKAKVVEDGIDSHVQEQTRFRPPLVNLATLIRRCLKKKEKFDFQEGQSSEKPAPGVSLDL